MIQEIIVGFLGPQLSLMIAAMLIIVFTFLLARFDD